MKLRAKLHKIAQSRLLYIIKVLAVVLIFTKFATEKSVRFLKITVIAK